MDRGSCVGPLADEFAGAQLGDARRTERLVKIADSLGRDCQRGFPQALETEAELKAFYRFVNNEGFEAEEVLAPHREATFARAAEQPLVVAVHDTTAVEFDLGSPRKGLGWTTARGRQGFFAHVTLLVTPEGVPLGVGHLETWTRSGTKQRKRRVTNRVMRGETCESTRWVRGVEQVEACTPQTHVVHVTDAEGDFFELLASLQRCQGRFVIRAGQLDRLVETSEGRRSLRDAIAPLEPQLWRDVALCERRHRKGVGRNSRRKHPERSARTAHVAIAATTVRLRKTDYSDVHIAPFEVHVVRVWEPEPPAGEPPVEWVLLTGESIAAPSDLLRVVDLYRLRWLIEEFFKALKSGCSLEKRQLESYDALCKVLALFAPLAYRLLLLRALERQAPDAPASTFFGADELRLLAHAPATRSLPEPRTLGQALLHLARLGGHLRHNGPPGWITLARGYEKLLLLRLGWTIAQNDAQHVRDAERGRAAPASPKKCDQS